MSIISDRDKTTRYNGRVHLYLSSVLGGVSDLCTFTGFSSIAGQRSTPKAFSPGSPSEQSFLNGYMYLTKPG